MTRRRSFDRARSPESDARPARTTAWLFLCLAGVVASIGCSHREAGGGAPDGFPVALPGPDEAHAPRYDRVWAIATHNSYWVDRGTKDDTFASGTNLRFVDQLLAGRARSIEIDVHRDPTTPGRFRVFHTVPGNDLCDDLRDCLAQVRVFHRALPKHEALNIALELKELFASSFDETHTIEDLDRVLREELPGMLYSPSDFLLRCDRDVDAAIAGGKPAARESLSACALRKDWPGVDELRGKVVVAVLGNWDDLGAAQATSDWVRYATKDDVRMRVAFPMASSWKLVWSDLTTRVQELVTQAELDAAFAQSIFLQIEALADPKLAPFLARHGMVRADGANTEADQRARVALGVQLLQTDTPFTQIDAADRTIAFHPLATGVAAIAEPGARLLLWPAKTGGDRVFAFVPLDDTTTTTWETLVSAGASVRAGCLRVADVMGAQSFSVCRTKVRTRVEVMDGGRPWQPQNALVVVERCLAGSCTHDDHPSTEPARGGPGDLIALVVRTASGRTCARARSTDSVDRTMNPAWIELGDEVCFEAKLDRIGLAQLPLEREGAAADEPVLFAGTRRDGVDVSASMLNVMIESEAGATSDPTRLDDLTVPR